MSKGQGGGGEATVVEARVDPREGVVGGQGRGGAEADSQACGRQAVPGPLESDRVGGARLGQANVGQGWEPSPGVVPHPDPGAVEGGVVKRSSVRLGGNEREVSVAPKTAGKSSQATRGQVGGVLLWKGSYAGCPEGVVEGLEDAPGSTRREEAEEVAEARTDAEAEEEVTLVWTKEARVGGVVGEEEAVEDGHKAKGFVCRSGDSGFNKGGEREEAWMTRAA